MINQLLINELHTIMLEDYGKDLSPSQSSELAYALKGVFSTLLEMEQG